MLRDDAVAYWEAWTRDRATAACMEQAGFTWYPEVAYPEETVVAIAEMLGISRSDEVATRVAGAEGRNRQMYDALKPAARDRYARVLYGESAADLDYVIETGLVPRGRDDSFATGGCTGQSRERVGSIWDLKNVLGPELLDAEKVIKSTQFGDFRDEYEACASALGLNSVTGPDDIDRLLTASSSGDDGAPSQDAYDLMMAVDQVQGRCGPIWEKGSAWAAAEAMNEVRSRHPELFDAQIARYRDVMKKLLADDDFRSFVETGQ